MTSTTDIFANADNSQCPDNCFRPVGLDLDSQGRLFMSSDSTGEIYVLVKTANTTSTSGTATSTASPSPSSTKKSEARVWGAGASAWWITILSVLALLWTSWGGEDLEFVHIFRHIRVVCIWWPIKHCPISFSLLATAKKWQTTYAHQIVKKVYAQHWSNVSIRGLNFSLVYSSQLWRTKFDWCYLTLAKAWSSSLEE